MAVPPGLHNREMSPTQLTDAEITGSWTAYPSLLPSLRDDEREVFESAACAHCCGRFQEADEIFEQKFHQSYKTPILALQHGDMLSLSGRETERVNLLQNALFSLSSEKRPPCLFLLLELMLKRAKLFALGKLSCPEVESVLSRTRAYFRGQGVDGLSDIELRCVGEYYAFVSNLEICSNFVENHDMTIFEDRGRSKTFKSKFEELEHIYSALRSQKRWRFAPMLMQQVLANAPQGPSVQSNIREAISICTDVETFSHPGIKFRSVLLKKYVANILASTSPDGAARAARLREECILKMQDLSEPEYTRWQEFCPAIADSFSEQAICGSDTPLDKKLRQLQQLAERAETRRDYSTASNLYMSKRDLAVQSLNMMNNDSNFSAALLRVRRIREAWVAFHRDRTRNLWFFSSGLFGMINLLLTYYKDYSAVISLVENFERQYDEVSVPTHLEDIYRSAMVSAKELGLSAKLDHFTKLHQSWIQMCPFSDKNGGLSNEAFLDSHQAGRLMYFNDDASEYAEDGTIELMIFWAANECDRHLLSVAEIERLFGPGLCGLPEKGVGEYVRRNVNIDEVTTFIFGTDATPRGSLEFAVHYQRLLEWAVIPGRAPSPEIRLNAINQLLCSRLRRLGKARVRHNLQGTEDISTIYEFDLLCDLQKIKTQLNMPDNDRMSKSMAISNTLVRSFDPEAAKNDLITDRDLLLRVDDCYYLMNSYHNDGSLHNEYHVLLQLIRLTWQRHDLFSAIAAEEVLPLVDQADGIFTKIREQIALGNPSDDLVALTRLSDNFPFPAHYDFGLSASLKAWSRDKLVEEQFQTVELGESILLHHRTFVYWAIHSKGRGLRDVLSFDYFTDSAFDIPEKATISLETGSSSLETNANISIHERFPPEIDISSNDTMKNVQKGEPQRSRAIKSEKNPFLMTPAVPEQIDELMRSLPENVVVIDYINPHHAGHDLVAVVYRKAKLPYIMPLIDLNFSMVDRWVTETLGRRQSKSLQHLDLAESMEKLAELSGLVRFMTLLPTFVQPGETVVLCPTGALHRVPIHAIPMDGQPLIERNPVVYCQSLTMLNGLWRKFADRTLDPILPKATILNPMPDLQDSGHPIPSTSRVAELSRSLNSLHLHGFLGPGIRGSEAAAALSGCTIFHYHGHIENPGSALDSILALNENAHESPRQPLGREALSARDLFGIRLRYPALVTLVGCASGVSSVSRNNDVLGLSTALFFAGAGAITTTLWPIEDEDGAEFAKEFYGSLANRKRAVAREDTRKGCLTDTVDVAAAMQEAVGKLRARKNAASPHHWAAFVLNGFWMLPSGVGLG